MANSKLLCVIAAVSLFGCSSQEALLEPDSWLSVAANPASFESDREACLAQSSMVESKARVGAIGGGGIYVGGIASSVSSNQDWDGFAACMEARGWQKRSRP